MLYLLYHCELFHNALKYYFQFVLNNVKERPAMSMEHAAMKIVLEVAEAPLLKTALFAEMLFSMENA